MSRPILELCHCQVSSIKICCDGWVRGGGEGWRDLGRDDRVAQADRPADIQCSLLSAANYSAATQRHLLSFPRSYVNLDINPAQTATVTFLHSVLSSRRREGAGNAQHSVTH